MKSQGKVCFLWLFLDFSWLKAVFFEFSWLPFLQRIHGKALDHDKIPCTIIEWKAVAQTEVARAEEKKSTTLAYWGATSQSAMATRFWKLPESTMCQSAKLKHWNCSNGSRHCKCSNKFQKAYSRGTGTTGQRGKVLPLLFARTHGTWLSEKHKLKPWFKCVWDHHRK